MSLVYTMISVEIIRQKIFINRTSALYITKIMHCSLRSYKEGQLYKSYHIIPTRKPFRFPIERQKVLNSFVRPKRPKRPRYSTDAIADHLVLNLPSAQP